MPGSRIPIVPESRLHDSKPDYVVILPWNLQTEIGRQIEFIGGWGAQAVVAVPELTLIDPAK
jgi:hypothetical protein